MSSATYRRRDGTAGIRGQLYETKLLSLIFYTAKYDDNIEQFQLASNMAEAGAFDDIFIKVKVNGLSKPLCAFIQCKHKDDSDEPPDVDLKTYLLSYIKIREKSKAQDDLGSLFHGDFQDAECYFVIYTNGVEPHPLDDDVVEGDLAKLNELIATGGIARRPYKHKEDVVDSLCEQLAKDKTISLAKQIATYISKEMRFQHLLSDEYILLYHVFLAQNVFEVSEIKPEGHRVATFRQDFFNTTDEYLTLFKDTLLLEILKRRTIEPGDVNNMLSDFIAEPTDVTKLSELIGTVVTYNNGQLELFEKYSKYCNQQLNQVQILRSTVNEAIELAAKDTVIKVPAAFGNKDLTVRGDDQRKERRINDLKLKIIEILDKFKPNNVIVIDESLIEAAGFLKLNGGLAGAIGNIFMPEHDTKYMKITNSCESLEPLAKSLYTKLVTEIHNLHEYKFYFHVKNVPRLSLRPNDYDKCVARDFLNNLLVYSKQAEEKEVEEILKSKIEDYQRHHDNHFQAKNDAMFLKYHDLVQKWWMKPKQAPYLTKDSEIFQEAINSIMKDPLMSSINLTYYISKTQHFKYSFHEDVVISWHLQDHSTTVIITENSVLTVVKVLQHLKNKDHAVLDLEYIVNLPTHDRNVLCTELTKTNQHKALIFVCDQLRNKRNEMKTFETIGKAVLKKKNIIITNHVSFKTLQTYFPRAVTIVRDENNSLIDMSEVSQKSILETRVMFQGTEVRLDLLLDDESKAYVKGDVLNTIISKETIKISKLTVDRQYDEIKHLYVNRVVKKTNPIDKRERFVKRGLNNSYSLKTLFDINDNVVLVTAEPGMGKSTLLTHLSLKTKSEHPHVWIVRVNLLEYSRQFSKWKQPNTLIDTLETTKFLCQVMLTENEKHDGKRNKVEFELEEDNGVVYLTQCTGDQWTEFELKLFLHFYNKGNIIFLFDGFDEICPHYKHEVIKCIKTINSHTKNHKIWVTSRPYTEVIKYLQRAFGVPYEIEKLSNPQKKYYLRKIWQSNLILKELDELQLQNVHDFLQFMIQPDSRKLQLDFPLQEIYIDAVGHIVNEIKTTSIPLWTFGDDHNDTTYKQLEKYYLFMFTVLGKESDNNPLNLLLRALFFINSIKDVTHRTNKWNRDVNTFTFYEQYLETKLKTIRFQGKNKMDIYNPDIMIAYDKELAHLISKHKKLAAYAIFNENINKLFSKQDLEEIKETVQFIELGGEKTGMTNIVAGIPIFINMSFTEYFAVEYICDLLKHENGNQLHLMDIIFNIMFSASNFQNIRSIFDYKIKIDETLFTIMIQNHDELIFNLLIEQGTCVAHQIRTDKEAENKRQSILHNQPATNHWPPMTAVKEHLHNIRALFVAIFEIHINKNNLSEFLDIIDEVGLLHAAIQSDCDNLLVCVFDKVKEFDFSRLNSVLRQNFDFLSTSRNYDEISSKDIIQLIRKDFKNELFTLKNVFAFIVYYFEFILIIYFFIIDNKSLFRWPGKQSGNIKKHFLPEK